MKRNYSFILLLSLASVGSPLLARAAEALAGSAEEGADERVAGVIDLDQVVVTATRTPKALKDAPVVTRVISSSDLRIADATNIQDLLTQELPGLEFGYAMSQETSLNMNGFGGNAILFLVDGERLAGETMDNVDYTRLNLDNVGRIEIVKGAASALYGANAVAGVVNIISRENTEPWTANVNTRYNTFNKEWRYGGTFTFKTGIVASQTNVQRTTSNLVQLVSPLAKSEIKEMFGGESLNLKERLTFTLSDKVKLIARGGYFSRISDRSNYADHYYDYTGGLKGLFDFSTLDHLEISYAYDQYDKARYNVYNERTNEHDYSNRQHVARGLYSHLFGKNTLTVGADYMYDYLTTYQFTDNEKHTQTSTDAFAQFDYNPLKWLNLVGSVRYDYFSASKKGAFTGRLAVMTKWDWLSIRANYSGGFRAPSLKEMYMNFDMANIMMIYGNSELNPEKSHNFNLAFEHSGNVKSEGFFGGQYSFTLMGFYNKYDSRITATDFDDNSGKTASRYCNDEGVKVAGFSFNAQYRLRMGLGIRADYNYQHVYGNSVDSQFNQPRQHSATWRIDYERYLMKPWRMTVALSGRYLGAPDTKLAEHDSAYSLWKFTFQNRLWDRANINFTIDNIFNYKPERYYYSTPMTKGVSFTIGASIDIDRFFAKK